MQLALDLAWRGWGRVHPNPLVGAVVLAAGDVAGQAFHAEFGGPHAEPLALAAAGPRARGAILVSTLEPCNHQGKQPPCTDAILAAGISRVVIGMPDPNPTASGGIARLRAAGVVVETGLLRDEAERQNGAFLHVVREPARPWVVLKLATSLDFRIADAAGRSRWISGPEAREYVHWLRAGFDGIAVGVGTARADDPRLSVRGAVDVRVPPARVVFDRRLELPHDLGLVRSAGEARTIVVAEPGAPEGRARALEALGVMVLRAPAPADALKVLREAGVTALLVEGGGGLAGELLDAGLVDRFYWIQAPLWLGDRGVPAVRGLGSPPIAEAGRWRTIERRALGNDTLLVLERS
jgi:diaminohydroxyphosphoribosylaminopyrimidine deaminase/5-amino-6-(5-phosphoribosylamino)uracil reductase